MPRTPLLRALRRLADDHRAADQLGLPIEEAAYSRREILKRGAVAGAGLVAGSAYLAEHAHAARGANAPRIAIIGGGIAGLTCALALQDKGVAADVYESSSRVGGRMHSDWQEFGTNFWDNGQQAELCGELIDSNHKTILQLSQRFGLATVDLLQAQPNGTEDTYWIFGSDYPYAQASIDFKPVHNTLQGQVQATSYPTLWNLSTSAGQMFDKMTLYDWITQFVPGGHGSQLGAFLPVELSLEEIALAGRGRRRARRQLLEPRAEGGDHRKELRVDAVHANSVLASVPDALERRCELRSSIAQHRSNRVRPAEQREHRKRHHGAPVAGPGEHAIVRHGARAEPLHVGTVPFDAVGRVRRCIEARDERGDTALVFDGHARVIESAGERRCRQPRGHDAVHVPECGGSGGRRHALP